MILLGKVSYSLCLVENWGWSLVKILKLKFGKDIQADFDGEIRLRFFGLILDQILKLKLILILIWSDLNPDLEAEADLKAISLVTALNPWVCCAFAGNFFWLNDQNQLD